MVVAAVARRKSIGASPSRATVADVVTDFLRREYGPLRHAAKLIARMAGATPRTAEAWLAGRNAPYGEHLINLMAECDELAREINRLIEERKGAHGSSQPEVRPLSAEALGQPGLIAAVEKGFSVGALERLAHAIAPHDRNFRFRLVPKATLARRTRTAARLSPEESARVARLEKVWAAALDVWGGKEAARDFLFRPHPMLEGKTPMDVVLGTEFGGPAVEQILGRLKYGSAA